MQTRQTVQPERGTMNCSIVVKNIKKCISKAAIKSFFNKFGTIQYIGNLIPSKYQLDTYLCYIHYSALSECEEAIRNMNNVSFIWNNSSRLYVEYNKSNIEAPCDYTKVSQSFMENIFNKKTYNDVIMNGIGNFTICAKLNSFIKLKEQLARGQYFYRSPMN
ncbi:hypothetical protein A3Q56_02150 [Intoshia linei]|uniref:RRM domain-containing protein n=1 Tax=Intoshia linei TaxID=1819745 RepID=A0A177B7I9_9BILA|nr:hypothetical protein A3Q56_02150 [Intoshia linei]